MRQAAGLGARAVECVLREGAACICAGRGLGKGKGPRQKCPWCVQGSARLSVRWSNVSDGKGDTGCHQKGSRECQFMQELTESDLDFA